MYPNPDIPSKALGATYCQRQTSQLPFTVWSCAAILTHIYTCSGQQCIAVCKYTSLPPLPTRRLMQKGECSTQCDGQDNSVDPHCSKASMRGDILTSAIPSCGFACQGGVLPSVLHFKARYLMFESTALFEGSFWEFFTLKVDSCHLDYSDQSENGMLVCSASQPTMHKLQGLRLSQSWMEQHRESRKLRVR